MISYNTELYILTISFNTKLHMLVMISYNTELHMLVMISYNTELHMLQHWSWAPHVGNDQ